MAAKTVGFAIGDDLRSGLEEVVQHYADGNRSEFLRIAVRRYQAELRLERLHQLREQAREERSGRILSADEVLDLVKAPAAA